MKREVLIFILPNSSLILSFGGHSSVGRAPALQAGCRGFESLWLHFFHTLLTLLSSMKSSVCYLSGTFWLLPWLRLGKALGAIASYSLARDVLTSHVVFCDASAYSAGYMPPDDIAELVDTRERGGTVLQSDIDLLETGFDVLQTGGRGARRHHRR